MGNKLYVANLAFHVTENDLEDIFAQIGPVKEVKLILDRLTGKSRGFGFVTMESDADGDKAISELNGKTHEGRPLAVTEARPREERPGGFRPQGGGGAGNRPQGGSGGGFRPYGGSGGGGGRAGGWTDGSNSRGGGRREKEKHRGPRPQRDFEEE
ncbi:MAG TPA: RNA-binding protein [Chthoniobacterales bacterium]